MDDRHFRQLLDALGLSWSGFRKVRKGVKKRVARHMQQLGCRDMDAYVARLETDTIVRLECERLLSVSISRFFRDRRLWETLQGHILPELATAFSTGIRMWSAGCACG